jgi:hypothetical protein
MSSLLTGVISKNGFFIHSFLNSNKMPSNDVLVALSKGYNDIRLVKEFVWHLKYESERTAEAGGHDSMHVAGNIHRKNREFHLIKRIMDELKIEFAGCKIELNCYVDEKDPSGFKWSSTDGIDDPKNDLYEIVIHWE